MWTFKHPSAHTSYDTITWAFKHDNQNMRVRKHLTAWTHEYPDI